MIVVSNDFKTAMTQPVKELQAYIEGEGHSIHDSDDLINFKISADGGLCKSVMRKLEAKYLGDHNLLGKWVTAGFGAKLSSGAYEYLKYGSFLVNELTISKDTGETSFVAYDKMINAMVPYTKLDTEYPINLYDYTKKLCGACGLELGNDIFGTNLLSWNSSIAVNGTSYINSSSIIDTRKNKMFYFSGTLLNLVNSGVLRVMGFVDYPTIESATAGNYTRLSNVDSNGVINVDEAHNYIVISCNMSVGNNTLEEELANLELIKKDFMLVVGDKEVDYSPYNTMNDWQIERDLWENIDGITYRDIFVQIAQATGSTCIVGADDKVYFKPITNTGEQLTYDNLFKLKLEDKYGEINSVVLSRTPAEDNVYEMDEASVQINGLTEFKIENNEIVDDEAIENAREKAIIPIYEALHGLSYYPFEATTEGLGWYEIGDSFNIVTDTGDVFNTTLFNFSITVDGSIKETLKAVAETKTQTQYQYATTLSKRVKNTEIIVNKQDGEIKSLVSDMYDEDGIVNEKYTQIKQDIEDIEFRVQNSGGNNLLKDSVMIAYANIDKQKEEQVNLSPWVVTGDGTLTAQSDANANNVGVISGHSFTLNDKTATQKVTLNGGTYYTFSTKIKKNNTGTCYVKIYNDQESFDLVAVSSGEEPYYTEYSKTFEPKGGKYTIEFYGSADSGATFTDNMLSVGEYKSQWTQANGEVLNTQVNVSGEGIRVKRVDKETGEIINGEYTIMSPTEFAGYSNDKEVFSLNKDVTEVEKLKARSEVTMTPIKVVPITTGDLQGWAFVPST